MNDSVESALVCGVDEAGRGPLAGDVYAAAVILDAGRPISGLADSKQLSAKTRARLEGEIRQHALAWAVASADVAEIDRLNILRATMLAMQRAVGNLAIRPGLVLVDGNRCPAIDLTVQAVVGGDRTVPAISAASILAKVARDRSMSALERAFPGYGFAIHKGYPTRHHIEALERLGPCPAHRRSFRPVREVLERGEPKWRA